MQKYFDTILSPTGRPIAGATVSVYTYGTTTLASVYSDSAGTTPASNPIGTDVNGSFSFYAADGRYTLSITASGYSTQTITDILLDDPANANAISATTLTATTVNATTTNSTTVAATTMTLAGRNVASYSVDGSGNVTGLVGPNSESFNIRQTRTMLVAGVGDSITAATANGNSHYYKLLFKSGGRFVDCGNFGVAGERSDQIYARLAAVVASGAKTVITQFGVNDISQSVAEATLRTNAIAIWAYLRGKGVQVIDLSLPPTNTAGNVPRYVQHNIWRKLYCRFNGIVHIDVWPLMAQATGAFATGYFADAVHPNTVAQNAVADAIYAVMNGAEQASPLLAYTDTAADASGFVSNAISFAGGPPATGWFASGTGGTYTVQPPDANDFGSWQRCAITAGTNVGFTPTAVSLASLGWTAGDRLFVGCKYRWVDASQSMTNNTYFTGIATVGSLQPMFGEKGGATGDSYTLQQIVTIASGTNVNLNFFASGTGYFEVNRPICVNLTKLGL
jgi:lysophospholipase L1-like esterase